MNLFLDPQSPNYAPEEKPSRLYVLLDQLEAMDEHHNTWRLLFDCVDANWFDANPPQPHVTDEYVRDLPLYVMERDLDAPGWPGTLFSEPPDYDELQTVWAEVALSSSPSDPGATLYANLYSLEGKPIRVKGVQPVSDAVQASLAKSFCLPPGDAGPEELETALGGALKLDRAAVYDVGQGSCGAAIEVGGAVAAYFDFGGGVLGNTHTFPTTLRHFCFSRNPPILLSHWDWDHWSSANRDPRSLGATWIAPRQAIGAVHWSFVQKIRAASGQLLIWPARRRRLRIGDIELKKCTGNGRNHSGLAVVLHEPNGQQRMLFPGDARYSVVPSGLRTDFAAVVVPHHGADMRNTAVPACPNAAHNRLVYSYESGNTYGHPRSTTMQAHKQARWVHGGPASPHVRETSALRPAMGHVGLHWRLTGQPTALPCGKACDLSLHQV